MFRRINPHAGKKARNYKDLLDITMAYILQSKYKVNRDNFAEKPSRGLVGSIEEKALSVPYALCHMLGAMSYELKPKELLEITP